MIAIKNVVRKPFDGVTEKEMMAKAALGKEQSKELKVGLGKFKNYNNILKYISFILIYYFL